MRHTQRRRSWPLPLWLGIAAVTLGAAALAMGPAVDVTLPALALLAALVALTYGSRGREASLDGVPESGTSGFDGNRGPATDADPHHFIAREFAAAGRGRPVTLVMFGFSRFDEFVEREGAPAATEAVREFGRILTRMTRQMNLSARYGWRADAFLSVLSDGDADAARIFVTRVRQAATAADVRIPEIDAGIVSYQPHLATPEEFVQAAERALDAARAQSFIPVRQAG